MKFTYDGKDYDIRFKYNCLPSRGYKKTVRRTICTISTINPEIPKGKERYTCVCAGVAIQHVNDKDVKSTARKIALGKAIDQFMDRTKYGGRINNRQTSAGKMVRRRIWNAYFEQCELKIFVNSREEVERMKEADEKLLNYAR